MSMSILSSSSSSSVPDLASLNSTLSLPTCYNSAGSAAATPFAVKVDTAGNRYLPWPRNTSALPPGRRFLQVESRVGYPASVSWWKKGEQHPNMLEINSSDQFYEALWAAALQDKLVVVDFYSNGCRSCKALYPKVCQLAVENPDIEILTINFHANLAFCRSLNVNVLPFFHFYRGSEGRLDAFSCSLSKIEKLRAAVLKHQALSHPPVTSSSLPTLPTLHRQN